MTSPTLERRLIDVPGPFLKALSQLDATTLRYTYQLTRERRYKQELKDRYYWTADGAMYCVEKDGRDEEIFLYLTSRRNNPILKHPLEAVEQILEDGFYRVNETDAKSAKKAHSTLRVRLSDLKLEKHDDKFSYFKIDTANYDSLNEQQRLVAERFYGTENSFRKAMRMLRNNGITSSHIGILNSDYVREKAKVAEGNYTPIAIVSAIGGFGKDFKFPPEEWDLRSSSGFLRGVRSTGPDSTVLYSS